MTTSPAVTELNVPHAQAPATWLVIPSETTPMTSAARVVPLSREFIRNPG